MTYRWKGHVGRREDLDVGIKRKEDLTIWKTKKDPIRRLLLLDENLNKVYHQMLLETKERIQKAWLEAEAAGYADEKFLLECVY